MPRILAGDPASFELAENHGLKLKQRVVDFIIAELRDLGCRIARGRNYGLPDGVAYAIAIRPIERVDAFALGLHASTVYNLG